MEGWTGEGQGEGGDETGAGEGRDREKGVMAGEVGSSRVRHPITLQAIIIIRGVNEPPECQPNCDRIPVIRGRVSAELWRRSGLRIDAFRGFSEWRISLITISINGVVWCGGDGLLYGANGRR